MDNREERIRSRAYRLWEEAGRPEGSEKEHWTEAEKQVGQEGDGASPEETVESATSVLGSPDGSDVESFPGEAQVDESGSVPVVKKKRASSKRAKADGMD